MISCIAIDDEPLALKQMLGYIEKTPDLNVVGSFKSAIKALEFLHNNQVDLMFVDINMPDLSGLEFVKSLPHAPKVIFVSAHRKYAAEGFKVDAADYLVKPISYSEFLKSVNKTKKRYFTGIPEITDIREKEDFIFIRTEYKIVRVRLNDITYIEGMRDYVRVHLVNDKPIMTLISIKKALEQLPEESFMRIHRSYIVNLNKITTIERNRIIFDDDVYLPISEQYKEDFQKYLDNNFWK